MVYGKLFSPRPSSPRSPYLEHELRGWEARKETNDAISLYELWSPSRSTSGSNMSNM